MDPPVFLFLVLLFGLGEGRVEIRTTKVGDDKTIPKDGDTVSVHYTGRLTDSRIFDTSRGRSPFDFVVGQGSVINGWDVMVRYMSKGQKARVIITYDDAYGDTGIPQSNPPIPPFATLIFDVEIVDVKRGDAQGQGNSLIQSNAAATQNVQANIQATQTGQSAIGGQIGRQAGQTAINFPQQTSGTALMGQTNTAGGIATAGGIQTGMFGTQAMNPLLTQQQNQQFNQASLIQQLNAAAAAAGAQQQQPQQQQQFMAQPGSQTFNALNTLQTQQQQLLAAQAPQQQFAAQTVMQQQPQFAQTIGIQQQPASQQIGMGVGQTRGVGMPMGNTNFVSQVGQTG